MNGPRVSFEAPLPAARVIGPVRLRTLVRRVAPVLSRPVFVSASLVVFAVIARAAAQLGFSYPQSAFLFGLGAIGWLSDGDGGRRER